MAKKKTDKKFNLEASFEDVLVCRKESIKTLLEVFVEEPENVTQENLGVLAGILEITDESPDSSYIVNYIISVLRKEYYSKTKRGSIESFEAALNKANLALAKLAEHGNISWLGKINAIVLAIERNNIHISQVGSAKTLLLRNNILTDITDGAQVPENPSPFKTFVDVLSGRLEKDDLLVVATKEIFDIFSPEEIKRSALKFSPEDFIRFLKTALGNELEKAAVLVTRIKEREIVEYKPATPKAEEFNAFSQASYSKIYTSKPKPKEDFKEEEKQSLTNEIKLDLEKQSGDFVDQKTGHIYIKEDYPVKNKSQIIENLSEFFISLPKKAAALIPKRNQTRLVKPEEIKEEPVYPERHIPVVQKKSEPIFNKEKFIFFITQTYKIIKKIALAIFAAIVFISQKIFIGIKKLIPEKKIPVSNNAPTHIEVNSEKSGILKKLLPRFSNMKKFFSRLDSTQKFYVALIILIIIIVPYFIAKIQGKDTEKPIPQEEVAKPVFPLEQDKNISKIDNLNSAFSKENLFKIINLNGKMFFVDNSGLTNPEDNQNYPFPTEMGKIKIATNMDDLNLIFLIDEKNQIFSWSPVSRKFQTNTIEITGGANITLAKTYLTYLYLIDKNNNQIYRFPRADTGFGEKSDWLKESLNLEGASDLAIGENIFLAENGNVLKFLQGKKQAFSLETTATPIQANKVYTKRDSLNLFILDSKNSRIIKLGLEGNIIAQYYNSEISSAVDFEVNEEANTAYFSNGNEVKSFEMK